MKTMIFYFSGTGNSKWIAQEMAAQLADEALDITTLQDRSLAFGEGQTVGLVFPVYAWNPPQIVITFAKKINVKGAFVFAICTCAEEAGHTMKKLSGVIPLSSAYSISMPSNYVIGAPVESDEKAQVKIANARLRIDTIAKEIQNGVCKKEVKKGGFAYIKSNLAGYGFNHFARTTKPFHVNEECNSCGLCQMVCLSKTITMKEGKPNWGKECYQCLSCINRCPRQAIEYGKASVGKGRYYFKNY